MDDLNGGYDAYSILDQFDGNKVGFKIPGKDLYKVLLKRREELGQVAFERYVNTKGKAFALVANEAKASENPVLIIYTVKK